MAVNYVIEAQVVDITVDSPKPEDVFLVDTNVWYWMTYTRASQSARPPLNYQITHYPAYANTALNNGARICQLGLSLAELTHLIEKAEFEIYAQSNPATFPNPKKFDKSYRHNINAERVRVLSEINAAWAQVVNLAEPITATIDAQVTNAALNRLQTEKIEGYDLFILETMKSNGIVQVITDDGDFATAADIQVFTANRNVVEAARLQGKLVIR